MTQAPKFFTETEVEKMIARLISKGHGNRENAVSTLEYHLEGVFSRNVAIHAARYCNAITLTTAEKMAA